MRCVILTLVAFAALATAAPPVADIGAQITAMWTDFHARVQDAIFKGNPFMEKVHQALRRVGEQFAEAQAQPDWERMSDIERHNVYLKIALAELRQVRVELEHSKRGDKALEKRRRELDDELRRFEERLERVDPHADEAEWCVDNELLDDDEETKKLAELGELSLDERSMGFSFSFETERAIMNRTRDLLTDLITNELKMLVLWMFDNQFTGGKQDLEGLANVVHGVRVKVMEYVFDVIRQVMENQSGFDTDLKMSRLESCTVDKNSPPNDEQDNRGGKRVSGSDRKRR